MKKLIGALLALVSSVALAATTVPVQLINPTGSSSGQAIVSTGASSAPAWGGVGVNGISAAAWASPGSIGATTANAGAFTTLSATGLITPSTTIGIKGTTAADNAQAGSWAEYTSVANTAGSAISNSTNTNVTSLSLTAGDWRVCGSIEVDFTGTNTGTFGWLTTTSAGNGTTGQRLAIAVATGSGSNDGGGAVPCIRVNSASSSTVYLVGVASFSSGTATVYGQIWADRRR